MALLDVKNLTKHFGGLTAVGDVTLELNEGELVGLIGPNGAGKTTLFNLLLEPNASNPIFFIVLGKTTSVSRAPCMLKYPILSKPSGKFISSTELSKKANIPIVLIVEGRTTFLSL